MRLSNTKIGNTLPLMARTDTQGRELGAYLAAYLGVQKLDDKDIAQMAGVPTSTYSRWSKREDFPTMDECALIADGYDIPRTQLLVDFGHSDCRLPFMDN